MLRAFLARAREIAATEHYRATLIWSVVTPNLKKSDRKPPPDLPAILRE